MLEGHHPGRRLQAGNYGKHYVEGPYHIRALLWTSPGGGYRLNLLKLVIGMAVVRPDRFESQVLSADNQAGSAKIRNHLVLTQTRYILWTVPVRFHVEVDAVEDCRLVSHDVILMRGMQLIAVDEKMYGQQTFHADFRRMSSRGTP
jgi:hypothetical protein